VKCFLIICYIQDGVTFFSFDHNVALGLLYCIRDFVPVARYAVCVPISGVCGSEATDWDPHWWRSTDGHQLCLHYCSFLITSKHHYEIRTWSWALNIASVGFKNIAIFGQQCNNLLFDIGNGLKKL